GFPTRFCTSSAPAALGTYGPITQNTTNNLLVILSHWDWDHWNLGSRVGALAQLRWLVPVQPMGPTATRFSATLVNAVRWPTGLRWTSFANGLLVLKC